MEIIVSFKYHERELIDFMREDLDDDLYSFVPTGYYLIKSEDRPKQDLWYCGVATAIENHSECRSCNYSTLKNLKEVRDNCSKEYCYAETIKENDGISYGLMIGKEGKIIKKYRGGGDEISMLEEIYPEEIEEILLSEAIEIASELETTEDDIDYI